MLFTDHKVGERQNPRTFRTNCGKFPVSVDVSTASVDFGGYHATCVVTSKVDISRNLWGNGFASFCCYDEATTMESAVAAYCEENGLTICRKENSWPYACAVVTKFEKKEMAPGNPPADPS